MSVVCEGMERQLSSSTTRRELETFWEVVASTPAMSPFGIEREMHAPSIARSTIIVRVRGGGVDLVKPFTIGGGQPEA